ncbi:hypothetical protein B566_EDAN016453 [Ephemera danica]|nr:hypothetical protein B566_EDAN016453 [Ephemera danica]
MYLRTPLAIERMIGDGADDIIFTVRKGLWLRLFMIASLAGQWTLPYLWVVPQNLQEEMRVAPGGYLDVVAGARGCSGFLEGPGVAWCWPRRNIFEDSFLTAHPLEDLGEGQFLVAAKIGSQLAVTHAMAELVTKLFVLDVAVVTLVGKGEHNTDKLFIGLTVLLTSVKKLGSLCNNVGPRSKRCLPPYCAFSPEVCLSLDAVAASVSHPCWLELPLHLCELSRILRAAVVSLADDPATLRHAAVAASNAPGTVSLLPLPRTGSRTIHFLVPAGSTSAQGLAAQGCVQILVPAQSLLETRVRQVLTQRRSWLVPRRRAKSPPDS